MSEQWHYEQKGESYIKVDTLHKIRTLETELAAVTEQRDEWKSKYIQQNKDLGCEMMDPNGTIWDYAKKLQTELIAAREEIEMMGIRYAAAEMHHANNMQEVIEQLTAAREEIDKWEQIAHDKLSEVCRQIEKTRVVTEQLTVAREELNTAREDQAYMNKDLTIAIEQRDRLAEAIRKHKFCDVELYEALRSLNQPTP